MLMYSHIELLTNFRLQLPDHALSLSEQAAKNVYHKFVQNNLIIKQGVLDKKKVYLISFYLKVLK